MFRHLFSVTSQIPQHVASFWWTEYISCFVGRQKHRIKIKEFLISREFVSNSANRRFQDWRAYAAWLPTILAIIWIRPAKTFLKQATVFLVCPFITKIDIVLNVHK